MSIVVSLPVVLQDIAENNENILVIGNTIKDCIDDVIRRYPGIKKMLVDKSGRLHPYVGIFINGKDAYPDEMSRPVKDGDEIFIIYTLAGG